MQGLKLICSGPWLYVSL